MMGKKEFDKEVLKKASKWLARYSLDELQTLIGTLEICYLVRMDKLEEIIDALISNPLLYRDEIFYMVKLSPPKKNSILASLHEKILKEDIKFLE